MSLVSGCKLGYKKSKGDKRDAIWYLPFLDKIRWLVPHKMYLLNIVCKMIMIDGRYEPFMAMEDLNTDSIFVGDILCELLKNQNITSYW